MSETTHKPESDEVRHGWSEVMWGALDYDGSMDLESDRAVAQRTAEQYDLPLYRVTTTYEQVIPPEPMCPCDCPRDMHIGDIGCPCALPGEPPCVLTSPESTSGGAS